MIAIQQLRATRQLMVGLGDSLGDAIGRCPEGFANHPLWNLGHAVATAGLLLYGRSGLDPQLPEELIENFRKGTSPATWPRPFQWPEVREELLAQPERLRADYDEQRFQRYEPYKTSAGVNLERIEDAISFIEFHDGIHLGYALAQRKLLLRT